MSEMKTVKFPGDAEPRVIVDGAAVHFEPQQLPPEKQSQARANIGAVSEAQVVAITNAEEVAY